MCTEGPGLKDTTQDNDSTTTIVYPIFTAIKPVSLQSILIYSKRLQESIIANLHI